MISLNHFVIQDFAYVSPPGWLSVRELKLADELNVINITAKPTHQS
jgi:hypothetical protein